MTTPTRNPAGRKWVPAPLPHLADVSLESVRCWEAAYELAIQGDASESLLRQLDALGSALDDVARKITSDLQRTGCEL